MRAAAWSVVSEGSTVSGCLVMQSSTVALLSRSEATARRTSRSVRIPTRRSPSRTIAAPTPRSAICVAASRRRSQRSTASTPRVMTSARAYMGRCYCPSPWPPLRMVRQRSEPDVAFPRVETDQVAPEVFLLTSCEQPLRVCAAERVGDSITEPANCLQCRAGIDHRRVAAVEQLVDAERRETEFERPPTVRRRLEVEVRAQRLADVDPSRAHALKLERRATGKNGEDDGKLRPAIEATGKPGGVGRLHLRRIVHYGGPPRGSGGRSRGRPRVDEEHASCARELVEEG